MNKRFYVACLNPYPGYPYRGYYTIQDRISGKTAQPDVLNEFGDLPLEKTGTFEYLADAKSLCNRMNINEQRYLEYLDSFTEEDFVQEPFNFPPSYFEE